MIEIKGNGAESIVFDGNFVMQYRHRGKEESAQNPATTYRSNGSPRPAEPHHRSLGASPDLRELGAHAVRLNLPHGREGRFDGEGNP
ncbi:MAG TPA: hypothetical protein VFW97_13895, partial [Acidimicrobiia bacterium]|nr:hypothetical protein [Acidimicrobiia bacterium]